MTYNRREFLQKGTASLAAFSALNLAPLARAGASKAREIVEFGRTKLTASRLGFGVGDGRGKVFQQMGQEAFTKLIRQALDRGIRYFDMDPSHIHAMLARALQGVDRNAYTLVTGTSRPKKEEYPQLIERYRKDLNVDCIDGVLITAVGKANWAEEFKDLRDTLGAAKEKGIIKACGVSVHGLEGLKTLAADPWVDFALIGVNHKGVWMDGPEGQELSDAQRRDLSMPVIQQIHNAGVGVASMKTLGATGFENAEERKKSVQFILRSGCVDTMPIRFETIQQLDEVIAMIETP